jgi:hypothetical protein
VSILLVVAIAIGLMVLAGGGILLMIDHFGPGAPLRSEQGDAARLKRPATAQTGQ